MGNLVNIEEFMGVERRCSMIRGDLDQMYVSNNAVRLMKFLNGHKALILTYAATLCFKKRNQCDHDVWCLPIYWSVSMLVLHSMLLDVISHSSVSFYFCSIFFKVYH